MDARRAALLEAMDLPRFVLRGGPNDVNRRSVAPAEGATPAALKVPPRSPAPQGSMPAPAPATESARTGRGAHKAVPPAAAVQGESPPDRSALDWTQLEEAVEACRRCALGSSRSKVVFGTGDRTARWMVVGEAPGADEDRQGEPFVGRAGQLLNAMLAAVGRSREAVYIANVLKCRPPANRTPHAGEVAQCSPNLQRQIELVNPELVLCFGRVAAHALLGVEESLAQLRGRVHLLPGSSRPVIVTYHPAYLLRSPGEKRKAWADLKFAVEVYRGRGA